MDLQSQKKKHAAEAAVKCVKDGMVLGLGTGSTVRYAIDALGKRVQAGLCISGIPTSQQTEILAKEAQIPLVDFSQVSSVDLTIDGADEITPDFQMIKGGGGALLREKIIAQMSKEVIIVVDDSKRVAMLGAFALPIEVSIFGWQAVQTQLANLAVSATLRRNTKGEAFITDNQHYILDCPFGAIEDPLRLEQEINQIPGVMINGLFINLATTLIIGYENHTETIKKE